MEKSRIDTRLPDLDESTFESALTEQSTTGQEVLSPLHRVIESSSKTKPSPRQTEPAYGSFRRSTCATMASSLIPVIAVNPMRRLTHDLFSMSGTRTMCRKDFRRLTPTPLRSQTSGLLSTGEQSDGTSSLICRLLRPSTSSA